MGCGSRIVVLKDGKDVVLKKNVENEPVFIRTEFEHLFSEMGTYSCHLEILMDGEYKKVSNSFQWYK